MKQIFHDESGATAIEYGLIASVIAAALAGTFLLLGDGVSGQFETVETRYADAND